MKRLASMAAGGLLLAASLSAQPGSRDPWMALSGGPFSIYSNAKPAKAQSLLLALEQLRSVIAQTMGPSEGGRERSTVIYAFGNESSATPYFSIEASADAVHLTEYVATPDATHMVLNAAEPLAEIVPWVFQAYLGQELPRRLPDLAFWARTGLADLLATMRAEGPGSGNLGRVRLGQPLKSHLETLRTTEWIPFDDFFSALPDATIVRARSSRQVFQAQAWLLSHYLMRSANERGRPALALFEVLTEGFPADETMRGLPGVGGEDLESSLARYARGSTMRDFEVTLDDPPPSAYEVVPVATDEMALRLGQYLVRAGSAPPIEAAELHLQPLTEDPRLGGDALATLAELRHKSGRTADAATLYELALAARPAQAMSYLNHAKLLAATGGTLEARRGALTRALELGPNLGEAWELMAETHQSTSATECARNLERALELMPERSDLAYNLAMANLRAGDPIAARRVVALRLRNPDHRQVAADASREIDRLEAVSAASHALRSGDVGAAIEGLESALATAPDPAARAQIQDQIDRLERRLGRQAQIDDFNQAVALVNEGRTAEARERLSRLLPNVEDASLRAAIEDLLGQIGESP